MDGFTACTHTLKKIVSGNGPEKRIQACGPNFPVEIILIQNNNGKGPSLFWCGGNDTR